MRTITFFRGTQGEIPVELFLDSLSSKQARKVTWVLQLIEELPVVPETYLKKLTNTEDIWEVRIQMGSDIFRILGFFANGEFIATNGFQKKSQKTPKSEIAIAEKRKQEYEAR